MLSATPKKPNLHQFLHTCLRIGGVVGWVLGFVGVALAVIGLLALWFPVHLSQYDQYGMRIDCGRGVSANLSQAADATGGGLVGKCGTALLIRRAWAIPTTVVGWALVAVIVAIWAHAETGVEEESTRFWELRGDAT